MSDLFGKAHCYMDDWNHDSQHAMIEIGSDRGEGSTRYFNDLAGRYHVPFYSVDVSDQAKTRLPGLTNTTWYVDIGSRWCQHTWPQLHQKIQCLYLDNFDFCHDHMIGTPWIKMQEKYYREHHDLEMDNTNSQIEHLQQMIHLLPYMANNSLIICDDTYVHNGCWIGKCGAVVVFLLCHGYSITNIDEGQAVMLVRQQ